MAARTDMNRHFAEISPVYRSVRTTDREPVERIARELHGLVRPKGADIGCGAGRYVLSMFETIPNLSLACVDASPAMLKQVDGLLRANGIDEFETGARLLKVSNSNPVDMTSCPPSTPCTTSTSPNSFGDRGMGWPEAEGCSSTRGCPSTMRAPSGADISPASWKRRRDC